MSAAFCLSVLLAALCFDHAVGRLRASNEHRNRCALRSSMTVVRWPHVILKHCSMIVSHLLAIVNLRTLSGLQPQPLPLHNKGMVANTITRQRPFDAVVARISLRFLLSGDMQTYLLHVLTQ